MNFEAKIENETRSRSFRGEAYTTRRVFLRSYPLQWGDGEEKLNENETIDYKGNIGKNWMKKIILALIHWSEGQALVLKKVKNKIYIYVVACVPHKFKPPIALLSA